MSQDQRLPPEKLAQLRQLVHSHVSGAGIQEKIRACLADTVAREGGGGGRAMDEDALLEALEEKGLIDEVMASLDLGSCDTEGVGVGRGGGGRGEPAVLQSQSASCDRIYHKGDCPSGSKCSLFLQVLGGRAFLDHLNEAPSSSCGQCQATFALHVHFRGQRFHSRPFPCCCEPDIREGFLLELSKHRRGKENRSITYTDALSISDQIHLVLTRTNSRGEMDLVSSHYLEWRQVLCDEHGRVSCSVELGGVGSEAKIPVGVLDVKIEMVPKSRGVEVLSREMTLAQFEMEKQRSAEKERLFLVYAKQWWKEYLQIRQSHSQRLVKIFAQNESGVSRPVCAYVHPLRAGRLLDSPREAARFVSLFPFERTTAVGSGSCSEAWNSLHAMLAQRKGDCEDHAVLLCSLLLGFGQDAYVCVGTKAKGLPHAWVMTRGHSNTTVTFWESITGQRYLHSTFDPNTQAGAVPTSPAHPYRTLGCLFNHRCFLANTQPHDSITTCHFDLHNSSHWKAMSSEAIVTMTTRVGGEGVCPPLMPSRVDPTLASNELELQLRELTEQHREDLCLSTVWDEELCYLLTPALASYETERSLGVSVGNEEFQDAIRNVVPEGHTFKGFPIQLTHRHPRKAFNACLKAPLCAEVLGCTGDQVRLAVRVRVFTYPEGVCASWIMFAVKYRSIV